MAARKAFGSRLLQLSMARGEIAEIFQPLMSDVLLCEEVVCLSNDVCD